MELKILYRDDDIIAIHKPAKLLVHRTQIDSLENQAAVQLLRDQIGQRVYPIHRLDRPTSGVLLMALHKEAAQNLSEQFKARSVKKKYLALVRGSFKKEILLDYPLKNELDENNPEPALKEAITLFKPLSEVEIPFQVDRYPTSRYSLIEAFPKTGRPHQIRRHLKHLRHPIIGDINHGHSAHNKFFERHFQNKRLYLICQELCFIHPTKKTEISLQTELCRDFRFVLDQLGILYHSPLK